MNHLAHLLLAGPDPALRAGGFLGDFVRGPLTGARPMEVELGIALHRHLDVTTDRHPAVRAAVASFDPPLRRWAPVALDVWFDHLLAADFEALADTALPEFARTAYAQLDDHRAHLPPAAAGFLDRMREHDLLVRYRDGAIVDGVLGRLATRSRRAAPLAQIAPELRRRGAALQACFASLLPDLFDASRRWRADHGQKVD